MAKLKYSNKFWILSYSRVKIQISESEKVMRIIAYISHFVTEVFCKTLKQNLMHKQKY